MLCLYTSWEIGKPADSDNSLSCLATPIILVSPVLTVTEVCLFCGYVTVSSSVSFVGKYLLMVFRLNSNYYFSVSVYQ